MESTSFLKLRPSLTPKRPEFTGVQKLFLLWRETGDKIDQYISCRVFFCEKRQKVAATDEIIGKHENQITPKQIIFLPIFNQFLKNNFLLSFKTI